MTLSDNATGALWMCASTIGFVCNDALMKSLAGEVPLFQAILIRGLLASALITLLAWRAGALRARPDARNRRVIGWRMAGEIGATTLFLTALFNMPLANVTAIIQAAPLTITLAAALFLAEPVGWRRYLAAIVGFAGVLLIVRPGTEGFNIYALVALAAVIFITLRDLSTRALSREVPSLLVTMATAISITLVAAVVTAIRGWEPVETSAALRLFGAAGFLLLGYHAGVLCMRIGEVGVVSPFRYTNLIWALILGWAFFGDLPSWLTLLGAAIVVSMGLYTLHREARIRKKA